MKYCQFAVLVASLASLAISALYTAEFVMWMNNKPGDYTDTEFIYMVTSCVFLSFLALFDVIATMISFCGFAVSGEEEVLKCTGYIYYLLIVSATGSLVVFIWSCVVMGSKSSTYDPETFDFAKTYLIFQGVRIGVLISTACFGCCGEMFHEKNKVTPEVGAPVAPVANP